MKKRVVQAAVNAFLAAVPVITFFVVSSKSSLAIATGLTITLAVVVVVVQALRRQTLAPTLTGFVLALLCALLAFRLGQRRAFFLLPAVWLPIGIGIACLSSIALQRPLAGLVLNGIVGGPERWWQFGPLRAMYVLVTWLCFGIDVVSGTLQRFLYTRNLLAWLTLVHALLPAVFAVLIALSAIHIRQRFVDMSDHREPPVTPSR